VPIYCDFGDRRLSIDGKIILLDAKGRRLSPSGRQVRQRAAGFRQTGIIWKWGKPQ
jgi:hypothetical protein